MSNATKAASRTFAERFRDERRKRVKRLGKNTIRRLADFLAGQSLVGDAPVLDNRHFPFLQPLADNWQGILGEAQAILEHRESVPAFHEVSPDQMRIAKGTSWRTFILYGFGTRLDKNCRQAPLTAGLLAQVPNLQTAWFSILGPGAHIPAHRGVSKGILSSHLGLIIPKDAEKCRMRVGDTINVWRPGEIFVFDDTYDHEVWNDTGEERVILLFHFDRPMRWAGRLLNRTFVALLKLSAYYQDAKTNMATFEDRFEAATRRANENLEKMSERD